MAFTIIYHTKGFLGIPAFSGIQPVPKSLSSQMLMQNSIPKPLGILFPATGGEVNQRRAIYVRNKEAETAMGRVRLSGETGCWLGACAKFLGF